MRRDARMEAWLVYWFWICVVGIPLLMFSARPESHRYWRMGRSMIAFGMGYGITMVIFYIDYLSYKPTLPGRLGFGWFIHGWLWTITYVGWWELVWRIRYRRRLISVWKGLGDDWLNGKLLKLACFGTLLMLPLITIFIIQTIQLIAEIGAPMEPTILHGSDMALGRDRTIF